MNAGRALLIGATSMALALGSVAVQAKDKAAAARKLALTGMQGGADCTERSGEDGKWRLDNTGKWVRCGPKAADPDVANRNNLLPLAGLGLVAGGGVAAAVGTGGGGNPASP